MTTQKKPGFGGQWVQIFRTGTHHDDQGKKHEIDAAFLDAVVSNLNLEEHEPPAVIGHPKNDSPAHGWVCGLRRSGEFLESQFCEDEPQFEDMVRTGKLKKRSASFYLEAAKAPGGKVPALRHVGFLGAQPPAVKGLRNIHFEEGEAATFEFSEGEAMTEDEKKARDEEAKKTIREQVAAFFKEHFGAKDDKSTPSFSEADAKRIVEQAVTAAEAKFSETLKERDTKIEELTKKVNAQAGSSTRADIVQFCESLGADKLIPAFKNMGVVEFMESLAVSDQKVTVISFAEEGGKEVEKKTEISPLKWFQDFLKAMPAYVQFGESFGSLKVTGDGSEIANPKQIDSLRDGMGVKKPEAATAAK